MELAALHAQLPAITAAGASVVAISPELPDHTAETARKNGVGFEVLSDQGNAVARQFGIAFRLPPDLKELYQHGFKNDLAARNGIPEYELPIPATFIIDRSEIIRLAFVDPDYTTRFEPAEVVRVVQGLAAATNEDGHQRRARSREEHAMQPKVLGISASPQRGGKVETLVQEVLSATRLPHELVRLHALTLRPCRACGACRTENVCSLDDDWNDLSHKIRAVQALVIGGWAFAGMLDAATKLLMERFWSLRHHQQLARGKVGAAVVVGANPELAGTLADALLQFMRNNGMNPLGRVTAAGANPCLGCEDALQNCEYSGVVTQYGLLERVGVSMYNPIEHQLAALKSARILGQRIGHKARHLQARGVGAIGGPGDEAVTGRAQR